MSTQPPLQEVKAMLKAFMDSKTSTAIDFRKVSQLVEVAIREHEKELKAYGEFCVSKWIGAGAVSVSRDFIDEFKQLKNKP